MTFDELAEAAAGDRLGLVESPKGSKRFTLMLKDNPRAQVMLAMGAIQDTWENQPEIQNYPEAKDGAASCVALLSVPAPQLPAYRQFVAWFYDTAEALQVLGEGASSRAMLTDAKSGLHVPFMTYDAADPMSKDAVWVRWMMPPASTAGVAGASGSRYTQFHLADEVKPGSVVTRPYDGRRFTKGHRVCMYASFSVLEVFVGKPGYAGRVTPGSGRMSMALFAKRILGDAAQPGIVLDESQPLPSRPAKRQAAYCLPCTSQGVQGYVVFGGADKLPPAWHPAEGFDVSSFRKPYALPEAAAQYEAKQLALEMKVMEVATDAKTPPGTKRYFWNDKSTKGNVVAAFGSFDAAADQHVFLITDASMHTGKGVKPENPAWYTVAAFPNPADVRAFRGIRKKLYEEIVDVCKKGKRTRCMYQLRDKYVVPGFDPEEIEQDKKERDEEEGGGDEDAPVEAPPGRPANFCAGLKLQVQPPGGITELQTQFYEVGPPAEPFRCTPMDGTTLKKGTRVVGVVEFSELKDCPGDVKRILLYTKYVFKLDGVQAGTAFADLSFEGEVCKYGEEDSGVPAYGGSGCTVASNPGSAADFSSTSMFLSTY